MHDTFTSNTAHAALIGWLTWFLNTVNSLDYTMLTHALTLISIPATLLVMCNAAWRMYQRIHRWVRVLRRKKRAGR